MAQTDIGALMGEVPDIETLNRITDLEHTVEQLRGQVSSLEDRLDSFMGQVSGHSHWITSEQGQNETDSWYR